MTTALAQEPPVLLNPDRFVTIRLYSTLSGLGVEAIRSKIKEGKWIEGREYVRSPDGGLFVDREGAARWISRKRG